MFDAPIIFTMLGPTFSPFVGTFCAPCLHFTPGLVPMPPRPRHVAWRRRLHPPVVLRGPRLSGWDSYQFNCLIVLVVLWINVHEVKTMWQLSNYCLTSNSFDEFFRYFRAKSQQIPWCVVFSSRSRVDFVGGGWSWRTYQEIDSIETALPNACETDSRCPWWV